MKALRQSRFRRWLRDRKGVAALELAMSLPVLTILMLGSVEFVTYAWAVGRVHDATATVGDLVSRADTMSEADARTMFTAADLLVSGGGDDGASQLDIRVTSAIACFCGNNDQDTCYFSLWSHRSVNGSEQVGYAVGTQLTQIPENLALEENITVIFTEATYNWDAPLNLIMTTNQLEMSDRSYFRPRNTEFVTHIGNQALNRPVNCENIEDELGVTL